MLTQMYVVDDRLSFSFVVRFLRLILIDGPTSYSCSHWSELFVLGRLSSPLPPPYDETLQVPGEVGRVASLRGFGAEGPTSRPSTSGGGTLEIMPTVAVSHRLSLLCTCALRTVRRGAVCIGGHAPLRPCTKTNVTRVTCEAIVVWEQIITIAITNSSV